MNRLKILYRDPRRKQPLSVLVGAVVLHIVLLIPILMLYQTEWMAENFYDINDSQIMEVARIIPAGWLFILMAVAAPLWEELVFRLWMGLRGRALPIFTTGVTIVTFLNYSMPLALGGGVLVLILTYTNLHRLKRNMDIHFRWWFYGSVFLFGLAHLGNFELSIWALPLIMPQLLLGLAISFIRVQRGFWMGVLFHAGWNGTLGLVIIAPYLFSSGGSFENETHTADWEVGDAWSNSTSMTSSDTAVEFSNADVGRVLRWMIHQYEGYALVDANEVLTTRVNFDLRGATASDLSQVVLAFSSDFGLRIDTVNKIELSYELSIDTACSPLGVTREDKTINEFLGLYYGNQNMDQVASILQSEYGIRFSSSTNESDERYNFFLSPDGMQETFRLLYLKHCIQVDTVESEVLRYQISMDSF